MSMRLSLIVLAAATPAIANVAYTFDTDSQGWGIIGGAQGFAWDGTLGNGGLGSIRARDIVGGNIDTWFFSAPSADLGDMSDLYGFAIEYDIMSIEGIPGTTNDIAEVVLVGAGIEIGVSFDDPPTLGAWTSWSITVDALSGWRYMNDVADASLTGIQATETDILAVLTDLQGLYIRGEYTDGPDQAAIDNVFFVPAPGAISMLGLAGLAIARRRRS